MPKAVTDGEIEGSSKFRTRERFPALTYFHKSNGASIWRSSQPREGLWGYANKSDQRLFQCIVDTVQTVPDKQIAFKDEKREVAKLHIIDARPKLSAIGNKVMGSGYENIDNYPSTWLYFCDIENIHKIRESQQKLAYICNDSQTLISEKWLFHLDKTDWLQYLAYIISGANVIVESVRDGRAVLVHCSDGWDRTSQLASLAELILDKHYRTIEGFEKLIEKDFIMFGHQFRLRLGHRTKNAINNTEYSPVFLQFLDCVHQVALQFPTIFEFNDYFLQDIAYHMHSMRFGTFLFNCDKERKEMNLRIRTTSLWTYMNCRREKYLNQFYSPGDLQIGEDKFYPDPLLQNIRLWEEVHLAWAPYRHEVKTPMLVFDV